MALLIRCIIAEALLLVMLYVNYLKFVTVRNLVIFCPVIDYMTLYTWQFLEKIFLHFKSDSQSIVKSLKLAVN